MLYNKLATIGIVAATSSPRSIYEGTPKSNICMRAYVAVCRHIQAISSRA